MPITRVKVNVRLLDDWRKERKYSVVEFCKVVDITRCAYYQYKNGVSPSEEVRNRLCYITSIPTEKLFTRTGDVQRGRTPERKVMVSDGTWLTDSNINGGEEI
jgi:transcriptional regulator with XRE-family HTH domain